MDGLAVNAFHRLPAGDGAGGRRRGQVAFETIEIAAHGIDRADAEEFVPLRLMASDLRPIDGGHALGSCPGNRPTAVKADQDVAPCAASNRRLFDDRTDRRARPSVWRWWLR